MKELTNKQKPIQDLYQTLLDLKKKLDDAGVKVKLNELNLGIKDAEEPKREMDPVEIENLKSVIRKIPSTLLEFSRDLVRKRSTMLQMFHHDPELVKEHMSVYEREGYELENSIQQLYNDQEQKIADVVAFLQNVVESSNITLNVPEFNDSLQKEYDRVKSLLRKKEDLLNEANSTVHQLQAELAKKMTVEDEAMKSRQTVYDLKHRIRVSTTPTNLLRFVNISQRIILYNPAIGIGFGKRETLEHGHQNQVSVFG